MGVRIWVKLPSYKFLTVNQRDKLNGPYLIGLFIQILVNVRLHKIMADVKNWLRVSGLKHQ